MYVGYKCKIQLGRFAVIFIGLQTTNFMQFLKFRQTAYRFGQCSTETEVLLYVCRYELFLRKKFRVLALHFIRHQLFS